VFTVKSCVLQGLHDTTLARDGLQRVPLMSGIGAAQFVNDITETEVAEAATYMANLHAEVVEHARPTHTNEQFQNTIQPLKPLPEVCQAKSVAAMTALLWWVAGFRGHVLAYLWCIVEGVFDIRSLGNHSLQTYTVQLMITSTGCSVVCSECVSLKTLSWKPPAYD
jgi:hypothetical protein